MSAALQSLDPTDLSPFWITSEKRVSCLPSTTGRVEMKIHLMDLLLAVPDIARHFRQAVCADVAGFAAWIRSMTAEERRKIERIVQEANLTIRDQSKAINLRLFRSFFNNFVYVLPWIDRGQVISFSRADRESERKYKMKQSIIVKIKSGSFR